MVSTILDAVDRGLVPDGLVRFGIRRLLRKRLREERRSDAEANRASVAEMARRMRAGPLAIEVDRANAQHYEVPPRFFEIVLGGRLKYSCGHWGGGARDLNGAEEAMLRMTCRRAGLRDGMEVLDLGCGWGSLALWVAEEYPSCSITAVSNSAAQKSFIEERLRRRQLRNVAVVTADVNHFAPDRNFDRVISIEMFEHARNYEMLLRRIASWLRPDGRLFVHIFCHRDIAYFFEAGGDDDWMARHFFSGGVMPSADLLRHFDEALDIESQWTVNGRHYQRTLLAWLANLDRDREEVAEIFRAAYGPDDALRWLRRWRVFFMACAELFGYRDGREWFVSHYLLRRAPRRPSS